MADWKYHTADEERLSRWGQAPDFTILSAESSGGDVPSVLQGFDTSVQNFLDLLR